jgi:chromatin remodeling complex protein RSC6
MTKQSNKTSTTTATATASAAPSPAAKVEKVAKAPKNEKAPKVAAAAATPAVAVAAPVVAAKTPKAPKVAKDVVVAAASSASTTTATVVEASSESVSISTEFSDFMSKLQQLSAVISSLKTEFRSLEKKASRELKTAAKASNKRKRKTGNRSPSGFVKPTLISDELANFLGKTKGTEMARTEVTREINAYIRANQLQDKANGRRINADTKLSSLLKLSPTEELTYFNLQRYMSPHFAKSSSSVAAVASA